VKWEDSEWEEASGVLKAYKNKLGTRPSGPNSEGKESKEDQAKIWIIKNKHAPCRAREC